MHPSGRGQVRGVAAFGIATAVLFMLAAMTLADRAQALPETPDHDAWAVEGEVYGVARHGDTTYLGGDFQYVGPHTGSAVALAKSGASLQGFPEVNGSVSAVEPDGSGGWYLGGNFTHVGGQPRANLAHVLGDGSVDPAFDPGTSGVVHDIELAPDGSRLFVGGNFSTVGGAAIRNLAAISPADGAPVAGWDAQGQIGDSVHELAVHPNGGYLYAGGLFNDLGGQPRQNFAELFTSTGDATAFCTSGVNGSVKSIELNATSSTPDSKIFIGGNFTNVFGDAHDHLARINYSACTVDPWGASVNGFVNDVALSDDESTVYVGGGFDTADGAVPRVDLAAFDNDATGNPTAWDPSPSGSLTTFVNEVYALNVDGPTIYVGGDFTSIGGQPRVGLAALDAAGSATAWHGNVGDVSLDIEVADSTVLAAGRFSTAKGVTRANLVALGAGGEATAWNPGAGFNTTVRALAVSPDGQTIYVGGEFSGALVGGQVRDYLAAVDSGGTATSWSPSPNSDVFALGLSPDGSTVYAGGAFSSVDGQPRGHAAAIDAGGTLTSWNPQTSGDVNVLLPKPDGSSVLAGGDFGTVGGTPRNYVAEVNASSGAPTPWDPGTNGQVNALALSPDGGTVYLGGNFGNVGGELRNYIGAADAGSGAATPFDADADSTVHALVMAPDGATVFAGGEFSGSTAIGGAERPYLAELDASTGAATGWTPTPPDFDVFALDYSGLDLLVGGEFESVGAHPQRGFVRFVTPRPPTPSSIPAADTVGPALFGVSVLRKVFAVGRRPTALVAASDAQGTARSARRRKRRRWPIGTAFRWRLSEPARTTIAIQRRQRWLRLGRRCVRPTRRVRIRVKRQLARQVAGLKGRRRARRLRRLWRKRICARFRRRGVLRRNGNAGRNRTRFSGRIGRRAQPPGVYRAVFRAVDAAGNRSRPRTRVVKFRIVRQKRPRRTNSRR